MIISLLNRKLPTATLPNNTILIYGKLFLEFPANKPFYFFRFEFDYSSSRAYY